MSAAYRLKSLTAYWCFCLHSFSKSKYTEKKRLHLTLSRGGTPRKFQLYTIWPACTGSVFLGLNLEGEGITANWQFRLMAVSVELLDMGGRGATFFNLRLFSLKPPFFLVSFFPFTETYKVKCKYLAFTLAFTPCKLWQLTLDSTHDGIIWSGIVFKQANRYNRYSCNERLKCLGKLTHDELFWEGR